jgi:hypothetical protein
VRVRNIFVILCGILRIKLSEIVTKTDANNELRVKDKFLVYDDEGNAFFENFEDIKWCSRKYTAL